MVASCFVAAALLKSLSCWAWKLAHKHDTNTRVVAHDKESTCVFLFSFLALKILYHATEHSHFFFCEIPWEFIRFQSCRTTRLEPNYTCLTLAKLYSTCSVPIGTETLVHWEAYRLHLCVSILLIFYIYPLFQSTHRPSLNCSTKYATKYFLPNEILVFFVLAPLHGAAFYAFAFASFPLRFCLCAFAFAPLSLPFHAATDCATKCYFRRCADISNIVPFLLLHTELHLSLRLCLCPSMLPRIAPQNVTFDDAPIY